LVRVQTLAVFLFVVVPLRPRNPALHPDGNSPFADKGLQSLVWRSLGESIGDVIVASDPPYLTELADCLNSAAWKLRPASVTIQSGGP